MIERNASGEWVIMPPAGGETGNREAEIMIQLGVWAKRDGTGLVYSPSTGFRLPNTAAAFVIEIKGGDERSAYCRQTNERVALPRQMFFPTVDPWVEQARFLAGCRIDSGHTIQLLQVTTRASPGKIVQFISATPGNRHDMFKVKGCALQ